MSDCNDPSAAPLAEAVLTGDMEDGSTLSVAETVLSIKNVSQMFNVSRLVLRYYEYRGLIRRRYRIGQDAVYGWADCDRLAFIVKCRRVGLSLREVVPILVAINNENDTIIHKRGQETCMRLVTHLEKRRKDLDEALAELTHSYSLLTPKILGLESFSKST